MQPKAGGAAWLELPWDTPTFPPKGKMLAQSISMHRRHSMAPHVTPGTEMKTLLGATTRAQGPALPLATTPELSRLFPKDAMPSRPYP